MNDCEIKAVQYFNRLGGKKFDNFLALINSISFLAFFWIVLVAVAILKHPVIANKFLLAVLLVAILHFGITEGIIKHFLLLFMKKRKRPYVAYPELIKPIGRRFSDSSFPSSHIASTAAMLFVIVTFYPSLFILASIFILVIAFSRLHNGMHYPTDILTGIILGFWYGWMAIKIINFLF
jgi:undecaprenyl-diphosphatase